jgi:hypothetical protein
MSSPNRARGIMMGAGILLLASTIGCTGARTAPPPARQAAYFSPMPKGPVQDGRTEYATILGPVAGVGPKTFEVAVRTSYLVWLGCRGTGGFVEVRNVALGLDAEMPCGNSGVVSGDLEQVSRVPGGHEVAIEVAVPSAARWELRIDAPRA